MPTYIFGFKVLRPNSKEILCETDLCLIIQQESFLNNSKRIVLAECKSYNSFESKDIQRLEYFRKKIPNAILVFAKLDKKLSKAEIKLIKDYVYKLRKFRRSNKSTTNLLILTGNELFKDPFQREVLLIRTLNT